MNDYIQKYGQNAIQAYKKSLRMSQSLEKDKQSPFKQQIHLLPKKSLSKRSLKSSLNKKNQSQTKLIHSKSIKHNYSKLDQQSRKKTGSFIQCIKKPSNIPIINGFSHTFNKPHNKKKLIISETPKSITPKLHINLNLSKQAELNRQTNNIDKDKLTQRIQRSSGKKHIQKCSTSHSKHAKRSYLNSIQNRLQDVLSNSKRTFKSLSKNMLECFQIFLSNQQDQKLRRVFYLIKQTVQKICNYGDKYKIKLVKAKQKINSLEKVYNAYCGSQTNSYIGHSKSKSKLQSSDIYSGSNKKKVSIQSIIMNQNYDLRRKINKLEKQLGYYTSQQASLMNVFGKFRNSQSQLRIGTSDQAIYQNFQSLKKTKNPSSLNKLMNRRSSQNLISSQQNENFYSTGFDIQKRLSFDPNALNDEINDGKSQRRKLIFKNKNSQDYQKDRIVKHIRRNEDVEQLSEQQDSQNEEQQQQ